jgi:hypothetical protein
MNRRQWYYLQLVEEADLNDFQDQIEDADLNASLDAGIVGVQQGLGVDQQLVPDLTVDVTTGVGTNKAGVRLQVPSPQLVDLSVDSDGVPTLVASPGNERWVTIFLRATRVESQPETDGYGVPLNYIQDEGTEIVVVQGPEAADGTAPRPTASLTDIILADIRLAFATATIVNFAGPSSPVPAGGIDVWTRRDDVVVTTSPTTAEVVVRAGTLTETAQQLVDYIDTPRLMTGRVSFAGLDPIQGSVVLARDGRMLETTAAVTTVTVPLPLNTGDVLESVTVYFDKTNANIAQAAVIFDDFNLGAPDISDVIQTAASGAATLVVDTPNPAFFPRTIVPGDVPVVQVSLTAFGDTFVMVEYAYRHSLGVQ